MSEGLTIRTGQHHGVPIRISEPALPMGRAPGLSLWWVSVNRLDDVCLDLCSTGDGCIELVRLEPQKYAVAVRTIAWIAEQAVMVFDFPVVQLEDKQAVGDEPFIL